MKEPKYKAVFAHSVVHCVVDEEKDKFLSTASIDNLKQIIPAELFGAGKEDLLPIASNLALINAANANDDAMEGSTAAQIYKSVVDKYLNLEHSRLKVIGHIISSGFSRFNPKYRNGIGSEILTEDDVKNEKNPFNLCYAAVLYRVVSPELCAAVVESNDPSSPSYLGISSSWEVGFEDYNIAVGGRFLKDAEIIKPDDKRFAELDKVLKANGGSGTKDGQFVYRVVAGTPIFLGAGLTENPASAVSGIVTAEAPAETQESSAGIIDSLEKVGESAEAATETLSKLVEITTKEANKALRAAVAGFAGISQSSDPTVNPISSNTITFMDKIKDIKDITDENLKVIKADKITDFISEQLKEAEKSFTAQLSEKDGVLTKTKETLTSLSAEHDKLKKTLETLTSELSTLKDQSTQREKNEIFSSRMSTLDEKFELSDEDRKIIAAEIKDLDEKSFTDWEKKMSILIKDKSKAARQAIASAAAATTTQGAVDAAIDNGKNVTMQVPNASTAATESFTDKVKKDPKQAYTIKFGKK